MEASNKTVVGDVIGMSSVEVTEPVPVREAKGIRIRFTELQIPQITFSGNGTEWSIRDILHVKRLLTREYKRYMRGFIERKKEASR